MAAQYNKESSQFPPVVNAKDLSIRLSQFFDHFSRARYAVWLAKVFLQT
jgi:hypothetical protein